jgi:hypothetical protein
MMLNEAWVARTPDDRNQGEADSDQWTGVCADPSAAADLVGDVSLGIANQVGDHPDGGTVAATHPPGGYRGVANPDGADLEAGNQGGGTRRVADFPDGIFLTARRRDGVNPSAERATASQRGVRRKDGRRSI